MNGTDFRALLEDSFEQLRDLTDTKGVEYAASADQLANFKRHGQRLGMTPEAVLLVYLAKHTDAIESYVRGLSEGDPVELSEPIFGRIDDAMLYLALLRALLFDAATT